MPHSANASPHPCRNPVIPTAWIDHLMIFGRRPGPAWRRSGSGPRTEPSLPASMAPRQPRDGRRRPGSSTTCPHSPPNQTSCQNRIRQYTGASNWISGARGGAASALPRLERGMVCGGAVPAQRRASPGHRAPDAVADAPCSTDAARSAWSERSLLRLSLPQPNANCVPPKARCPYG